MIRRELHIDVTGNYGSILLTHAGGSISVHSVKPDMVCGDHFDLRLHFWQRETNGSVVAADPGATAQIHFAARPAGNTAGTDVLFHSSDFVEESAGIWDGSLNLATQELIDYLAATPPGDKVIRCEIEIRNSSLNTRRISLQFDATARPNGYNDEDAPTALPTPQAWLMGNTAPVNPVSGVAASGTLTFTGSPTAGQTFQIGSTIYYLAPGTLPEGPTDIVTPFPVANATTWAAAVAARINTWNSIGGGPAGTDPLVTATSAGGVVTITAKAVGLAGNAIALTEAASNCTVSGATLTGGVDAVAGTSAPPYFRVAGGKLYVQEAGVWKSAALTLVP